MKIFKISNKSTIYIDKPLSELEGLLPKERVVIITDKTVFNLYKTNFPNFPTIQIGESEKSKTLKTLGSIVESFLALGVDRSWFVLGIGGGLVCDVAGFAASVYMRGLPFGFVATTLLAGVDASIGGKNGVNFGRFKNIIGTFTQPKFVLCDLKLLTSLPTKQIKCGYAEIIKHAIIADKEMFDILSKSEPLSLEPAKELIERSVDIKSQIVERDEKEAGERKKLNFGHTIGHAIENTYKLSHGLAVGFGILIESRISFLFGYLSQSHLHQIEALLSKNGLKLSQSVDKDVILTNIQKDKKRHGKNLDIVVIDRVGSCFVRRVSFTEYKEAILTVSLI